MGRGLASVAHAAGPAGPTPGAVRAHQPRAAPGRAGAQAALGALYATSLRPDQANTRRLQRIVRAHWGMENQLHHPKDRTWLEDRHWMKNKKTGAVLTVLRSIACGLTRRARARGLNHKAHCPERIEFFNHSPRRAVALVKGGARF